MVVCVRSTWLGLEFEFVVVRNVVKEVERKMLPNFGDHQRSPGLSPAAAAGGAAAEKMFLVEKNVRSLME